MCFFGNLLYIVPKVTMSCAQKGESGIDKYNQKEKNQIAFIFDFHSSLSLTRL